MRYAVLLYCLTLAFKVHAAVMTCTAEGASPVVFRVPGPFRIPEKKIRSEYYPVALQIISSFKQYLEEESGTNIPGPVSFEFIFSPRDLVPSFERTLVRIATVKKDEFSRKKVRIMRLSLNRFRVRYIRFHTSPNENGQVCYDLYHLEADSKGRTLRTVIIKSFLDRRMPCKEPFYCFSEGREIQYKGFTMNGEPTAYRKKQFTVNRNGYKQWTRIKECRNRMFHPNGLLSGETIHDSQYTYREEVGCLIYNLMLDKLGRIHSYEYAFLTTKKRPAPQSWFYHALIQETSPFRDKRIVRQYLFSKGKRCFQSGNCREASFDEMLRLRYFKDSEFLILPGKDGLSEADRKEVNDCFIFNTAFNENGRVLTRRVLNTILTVSGQNGSETLLNILSSYREIRFFEEKGTLKKVMVSFYDAGRERILTCVRQVIIKIMQTMKNDGPSRIRFFILSPDNAEEPYEQEIVQDCGYIIDEAVFGDLFIPRKKNRDYDIHVQTVTPEGEITEWVLCHYEMMNGNKIYRERR